MTDPSDAPAPARRTFAARLKRLRLQRVLSREALAAATGLSAATLGAYERAEREPALSALVRLAQALRVTPDALLGTEMRDADPPLADLFEQLRLARPEQVRMVTEFWAYLQTKEQATR